MVIILEYLKGLATNIPGAKQVNLRHDIQRAKNIAAVYDREMMKDDVIFDIEGKLIDIARLLNFSASRAKICTKLERIQSISNDCT